MSYTEVDSIKTLRWKDLSAGWYPGKEHNLIPDNGAFDANHVVWIEGALRKMFGFDNVNTTTLESSATVSGLMEFRADSNNLIGVVGTRVYEGLQSAVPTVLSGVTLTAGRQVDMMEYNNAGTSLVIGVNGVEVPWSFDGTTLQNLAGSPPTGRWVEYFNNYVFIAQNTSATNRLYFSALNNPESWNTGANGDFFVFDGEITGLKQFQNQLVVFKNDSIGILSGYGLRSWVKTDRYIEGVGCAGGHSIVECRLGGPDGKQVLVFLAKDGIYAYDGTPNLMKLSNPIERKYIASGSSSRWNENRFANAFATYWAKYNWYILSLSDGGDTRNDFVLILDMARPYQTPDKNTAVPHWPMDAVNANCITVRRNSSNLEEVYFGDTTGFVFKYDPAIFNENGSAYTGLFTSKVFDMEQDWIVRETNAMFDQTGGSTVQIYINADLQSGLGETDTVNLAGSADVLDSTFIMGTSTFGGNDFLNLNADIANTGRFLQWSVRNTVVNNSFALEQFEIVLKMLGFRTNITN